ncbi:segregation/condensation protein A [Vagococcus xieshaowenii]|uniref:Segregation and condensation protein A n=1 Tax=Vagococcus xieshaowenii TaxID=2562451 RepID=A0AAJ5JL19_9ENTE|nr:segregation/condensation protein A [Vagococcus xieshaowenii]QCA28716.1 segregation/condensation protein A [Vagococcus xieshaowenii]TFZ40476.1 segregation/condensation protein A [Vagococcus xieshaowenii]
MTELNLKLEVFEGPLDLLLHLIKTLEVDVYDIPIAEITSQYMKFIHSMKELQLEVAGEYMVMAATLMSIKSKMLLPKQELMMDDELLMDEEEDPREALVAQLLEYRKFKYAAGVLKEKEHQRGDYYSKEPMDLDHYQEEIPELEPDQVTTIDLFFAFHDILERRKHKMTQETTIRPDKNSIEEQMNWIESKLNEVSTSHKGLSFESLFITFSKSEIVTTFMAMLELIKKKTIIAKQVEPYAPIVLFQTSIEEVE